MKNILIFTAIIVTGLLLLAGGSQANASIPTTSAASCTNNASLNLTACPGCTNTLILNVAACPGCTNNFYAIKS